MGHGYVVLKIIIFVIFAGTTTLFWLIWLYQNDMFFFKKTVVSFSHVPFLCSGGTYTSFWAACIM
jgi:hypothetical protein